ncbi:hypothetical protein EYF80_010107 [Liparis tanakae]|uniref:Uncharacterized protein n=1 Tax=Liparis tanakae TaxID=230148 RepID=A0A4Z2IRB6_9TELE|nr:hypothetical protein EYF80_010107 [Liparis tanakae]
MLHMLSGLTPAPERQHNSSSLPPHATFMAKGSRESFIVGSVRTETNPSPGRYPKRARSPPISRHRSKTELIRECGAKYN